MSNEKKPYQPPKVFQVELNQDQAILTTCETGTTNISANKTKGCTGGCKKANAVGGSAAHPS